mmetsp:Transcript_89215/g.257242  ORF Transcript_89215/g.257242 Transcript_89215/m.257242 type:complete len:208 (+) Transcript_89215:790-1413(+)
MAVGDAIGEVLAFEDEVAERRASLQVQLEVVRMLLHGPEHGVVCAAPHGLLLATGILGNVGQVLATLCDEADIRHAAMHGLHNAEDSILRMFTTVRQLLRLRRLLMDIRRLVVRLMVRLVLRLVMRLRATMTMAHEWQRVGFMLPVVLRLSMAMVLLRNVRNILVLTGLSCQRWVRRSVLHEGILHIARDGRIVVLRRRMRTLKRRQ